MACDLSSLGEIRRVISLKFVHLFSCVDRRHNFQAPYILDQKLEISFDFSKLKFRDI